MFALAERPVVAHVRDTILELLGLDHTQLLHLHQGRPERPTVNESRVIDELL